MEYPNFQDILRAKREYHGQTEAAIEFAAKEFARQHTMRLAKSLLAGEPKVKNEYSIGELRDFYDKHLFETGMPAFEALSARTVRKMEQSSFFKRHQFSLRWDEFKAALSTTVVAKGIRRVLDLISVRFPK